MHLFIFHSSPKLANSRTAELVTGFTARSLCLDALYNMSDIMACRGREGGREGVVITAVNTHSLALSAHIKASPLHSLAATPC